MKARLKRAIEVLSGTFWVLPGLMTLAGIILALVLVYVDRSETLPRWLLASAWLYNGGSTGARTLLGAVASSTIGVAGTVFSITIAALSLAAGQMGPRLLRNFTKDRGNQFTLGAFLGTFSYSLMVLRAVRSEEEGAFVPHLSLTFAIFLAFVCVGTLIYFVDHIASRINVDTVIDLVSDDVRRALQRLTVEAQQPSPPPLSFWDTAAPIADDRRGYLQQLDAQGLAQWAVEKNASLLLLVRPGDYVFPGAPIAFVRPQVEGARDAVRNATALGPQRDSSADIEFAVRQLVEVAVRALSPGINDPHTAISVIDRLGAALCDLEPLYLPTGVTFAKARPVLVVPSSDYDGLVDAMFHMIRQNGMRSTAVLTRILDVLTTVVSLERQPARVATLQRHANLVLDDAGRNITSPADLNDIRERHRGFVAMKEHGPLAAMASWSKPK
ncbi:MAG: formate C-acetyltransferase glycine radical [Rhizobiales bacterium 32-66-11]|nr:MAG: formate C-acetyltransferase glycine radical [Rhizobiales bacterium 32-66-11]